MLHFILQTIAWLIAPREDQVFYRIDRITQTHRHLAIEHGIDAILAASPYHALMLASRRNYLKTGQLFRAVYCQTQWEYGECIRISMERDRELNEFEEFMGAKQGQER
jgi:hypothetical protein